MFRFRVWAAVLLPVLVLAAREAKAGIGFQPVSQEELKMSSEPLAPGAPAIILFHQVERDDNPYTGHEGQYFRIKILTEEGRGRADVEIPFLKERQTIVGIHARTIRPDGSIVDFGGQIFEKYLEKGKYKGWRYRFMAKTFTLTDVQVGSIIEYFYTIDLTEHLISDSEWLVGDKLFTKKAQFWLKPFLGDQFQGFTMHWTWQGLPDGVSPKKGADGVVRMEVSNIPGLQEEDYMPPPSELKARVDFIYEEGFAVKSQEGFWKEFGKERHGKLESFVGKKSAMEQAVTEIVSPNDPPEVKLRKIYDRVQQIRNTTNEFVKTEQEEKREKEPENVEEVWRKGYGDATHLTWLFLGLARAAGFEAYGCRVASREENFFKPSSMQSSKLDRDVVLVKLNGKDVYFMPGRAYTPFGMLPWQESGVPGLRLDSGGGTWIQTSLADASESRVERVGKLKLNDTGSLEGKVTLTYTGLEGMEQRVEERHADEAGRKKFLEDQLMAQIGSAAEVELTNKPDWSGSVTPLVGEFDVKIPGWAAMAGRRVVTPAAIFTADERGVFEHAERAHPIYFNYLFQKSEDLTIELPTGWQVSSVPPPQDQNMKVVAYSLKVEQGQSTLHLTRKVTIDIGMLEQKYYGPIRTFFQVVRTGDAEKVVLQPGEIHASN